MDPEVLLKEISKPISKAKALALAVKNSDSIPGLISLCLHSNNEIAFRAAWITETVAHLFPERFDEYSAEFIDAYIVLKNGSVQRHFTKVLMTLTGQKNKGVHRTFPLIEKIIETTFEWMIDVQTPVAVKVNCMDILYNLKEEEEWIADELRAQIRFQLKEGSAALQSRGKKVLRKLSE